MLTDFNHSQNSNLNTSFEVLSHELLNACFSFEIGHSKLKLKVLKIITLFQHVDYR